jgi:hypothetical protein
MTKCSSCGAQIIWAKTMTGKAMPLDAKPDSAGNVSLKSGFAVVYGGNKHNGEDRPRWDGVLYKSHFATCPNAKSHRKARP